MNYKIIGKYIKNLNFSIPNSKTFFLLSKDIENYKINIDIKSNQVKQNIIEISTSLNLAPTKENSDKINTEITFATIVELLSDKRVIGITAGASAPEILFNDVLDHLISHGAEIEDFGQENKIENITFSLPKELRNL